jgi:Ca-activated chloride channel homolog
MLPSLESKLVSRRSSTRVHAAGSGAFVLGLTLLAFAATGFAQESTFRVDVRLVRVLATVRNADGQLVGGLNKEDFSVTDNGARQEIALFERQTEQPLSVALLIDTSGSTAKDLKYEIESVTRFLHALFSQGNPDDAVALYAFNYETTRLNRFTRNQGPLERSLRSLKAEAGTSLYDAVFLAAEDLEEREGRRVVVVVTDGGDTTSSKDFHAALEAAQLADAVMYPILVVPITNEAGRNTGGEHALTTLAAGTGGRVFAPSVGAGLDRAFSDIIQELRTQYLLGFYPRNVPLTKERFHRLQITVNRPGLRVLARNGYYGDSDADTVSSDGRTSIRPEDSRRKPQPAPNQRKQERK